MRPVPTDFARYRRLRRSARAATLGLAVVVTFLGYRIVRLASQGGPVGALAMVPYVALCVVLVSAWFVLVPLWRRTLRARPTVQSLEPSAGEVYGIPELDADPPRHRGLSGEEPPPTRW